MNKERLGQVIKYQPSYKFHVLNVIMHNVIINIYFVEKYRKRILSISLSKMKKILKIKR